jgi:thiol-disulfide isomerase/thioredoxin
MMRVLAKLVYVFCGVTPLVNAATPAKPPAIPQLPRLHWPTLESSPGHVMGCKDGFLLWQSDFLAEPVELDQKALLLLEEPRVDKHPKPAASWKVDLRNGDTLLASMLTLEKDAVVVAGKTWPVPVTVPWKHIAQMRRLDAERVIYAGPTGIAGWEAPGFYRIESGALATRRWNQAAMLRVQYPEMVSISLSLRSTLQPEFELSFEIEKSFMPRLETWKNRLVLVANKGAETRFVPLLKLEKRVNEVRLTLCWDRKKGVMQAYAHDGRLLGSITEKRPTGLPKLSASVPPRPTIPDRVHLLNRGLNLVLDELVVTEWNGRPPAGVKAGSQRLEKLDHGLIQSEVTADADGLQVGGQTLPLSQTRVVVLSDARQPISGSQLPPSARWADGTRLAGPLVEITAETVTVKTEWSTLPVTARRQGLTRILFGQSPIPGSVPEFAKMDLLKSGAVALHGALVSQTGQAEPLWKLPGARAASVLKNPGAGNTLEVLRARKEPLPTAGEKVMAFFSSGEVARTQFQGMTEDAVNLNTPLSGSLTLPTEQMRALRWIDGAVLPVGFRDTGWRVLSSSQGSATVQKSPLPENDVLKLKPDGGFGHPSVVARDEIKFRMVTESWGGLKLNLFVQDLNAPDVGSFVVTLFRNGDTIYAVSGDENDFNSRQQTLTGINKPSVDVRISFVNDIVEVIVNEIHLADTKVPLEKRNGTGLVFRAGALWGNSPRGASVSGFRINPKPGSLPMLSTSSVAKAEALSIPRFRREVLPSHALVAANGDIVRGRIEVATNKLVRFTSGVETMEIPRDRLEAMVWLKKPVEKTAAQPKPALQDAARWLLLHDGSLLALKLEDFGPEYVKGTSLALGEVKVPQSDIASLLWAVPAPSAAVLSHTNWQLVHAPEPVLPEAGSGGAASPLLGKAAPDFKLPLLHQNKDFSLAEAKGSVLVLDFWATWCGPCIVSIPETMQVVDEFAARKVKLLAINQGEPSALVKRFVEQRNWKVDIVLDTMQQTGSRYLVEGLPFTVVIDPAGKVFYVTSGHSPKHADKLRDAIKQALGGTK